MLSYKKPALFRRSIGGSLDSINLFKFACGSHASYYVADRAFDFTVNSCDLIQ